VLSNDVMTMQAMIVMCKDMFHIVASDVRMMSELVSSS
jgi:hypothetical protein